MRLSKLGAVACLMVAPSIVVYLFYKLGGKQNDSVVAIFLYLAALLLSGVSGAVVYQFKKKAAQGTIYLMPGILTAWLACSVLCLGLIVLANGLDWFLIYMITVPLLCLVTAVAGGVFVRLFFSK